MRTNIHGQDSCALSFHLRSHRGYAEAADVAIKRVPETVPEEVARGAGYKMEQAAPIATVAELESYDAIIVGVGTRYGRMVSQMASFLDRPAVCGPEGL